MQMIILIGKGRKKHLALVRRPNFPITSSVFNELSIFKKATLFLF